MTRIEQNFSGRKSVLEDKDMLGRETISEIRIAVGNGMGIREAARKYGRSRATVRKILRSGESEFAYKRKRQPYRVLGPWIAGLCEMLSKDRAKALSERRSAVSLFRELRFLGYGGSYSSVRRFCSKWRSCSLRHLNSLRHDPLCENVDRRDKIPKQERKR